MFGLVILRRVVCDRGLSGTLALLLPFLTSVVIFRF